MKNVDSGKGMPAKSGGLLTTEDADQIASTTLTTTWPEFKKMASDFFSTLYGATREQAEAGLKCLSLGYIGMQGSEPEQHQARMLIDIASRRVDQRISRLVTDDVAQVRIQNGADSDSEPSNPS